MHDPWVRARGLSVIQDLEAVGPTLMPGLSVRMSRTPPRLGDPVRHHGRDAALVLAAVGSRHSVTELEQLGVLRVTGSPPRAGNARLAELHLFDRQVPRLEQRKPTKYGRAGDVLSLRAVQEDFPGGSCCRRAGRARSGTGAHVAQRQHWYSYALPRRRSDVRR